MSTLRRAHEYKEHPYGKRIQENMRFCSVSLLATLVALAGATKPSTLPKGFATTNGRHFELDGKPFVSYIFTVFCAVADHDSGFCRSELLCMCHSLEYEYISYLFEMRCSGFRF